MIHTLKQISKYTVPNDKKNKNASQPLTTEQYRTLFGQLGDIIDAVTSRTPDIVNSLKHFGAVNHMELRMDASVSNIITKWLTTYNAPRPNLFDMLVPLYRYRSPMATQIAGEGKKYPNGEVWFEPPCVLIQMDDYSSSVEYINRMREIFSLDSADI